MPSRLTVWEPLHLTNKNFEIKIVITALEINKHYFSIIALQTGKRITSHVIKMNTVEHGGGG